MITKESNEELFNAKTEIEELAMQLADMLGAALHFAGAKKNKMRDAVEAYLDGIDEVFDNEEGEMGFEEVVKVIEHIKKNHPNLFDD